jgi:hypothetical protein
MEYAAEKRAQAMPKEERLHRLDKLSQLLDSAFTLPGTRIRFGLDGILGLIPGVGDVGGALLSFYIILEAARLGFSITTLVHMLGNVAVEAIVGAIPILGDIFDIGWKANIRNVALLRTLPIPLKARSTGQLLRLLLVPFIVSVIGLVMLIIVVLKFVLHLIFGSVPNLLLIELLAKQISWLEAHTNIVETLP